MTSVWNDKFDKILVEENVKDSRVALRFFEVFGDKVEIVKNGPKDIKRGVLSANEFSQSKRQVYLTEFKGQFFKKCPGFHKGLACCNYYVLNLGFQCDMDCSYCYLQSFINSNYLTLYTNLDDALNELRDFSELKNQPLRVGTGEVIDSLSMDPITLYSRELISFFKDYPMWKLEFKTKSAYVDQFLDCDHAGNVIVSWSINPAAVIDSEEHLTASFEQRMNAARAAVKAGFQVSFHIDPMIWHPEWKKNYGNMVKEITQSFQPKDIPYLSVGALRYQPEQKNIMRERFPMSSMVNSAETFRSQDGKLRYDHSLRKEMFSHILGLFKENDPTWKIFMCMETPETWVDTFGHTPAKEAPLKSLFQPIG